MRAKNVDLKVKANGTVIMINWNSEGEGWGEGRGGGGWMSASRRLETGSQFPCSAAWSGDHSSE